MDGGSSPGGPNGLAVGNDACFLWRFDYEHVVSMGYLCGYGKVSE